MLTAEENERLTKVGPGTPMGDLLRQYWHPIAAAAQLDENPVRSVRLLGEDLTLFRDKRSKLGLIADRCAHRHVKLVYGIPEEGGLRCCYHGWLYDHGGRCIEQPAEPADSRFKDKIRVTAYPVQELVGTVWAYLGPEPAPLLPRWDRFAWEGNIMRCNAITVIPCNWLQIAENYPDFAHAEWLHGWYFKYILERKGVPQEDLRWLGPTPRFQLRQRKNGWSVFDHGIVSRILLDGRTEVDDLWTEGHSLVFPNTCSISSGGSFTFEYAVPMDDTHTLLFDCYTYKFSDEVEVPKQGRVPYFEYDWDMKDENGETVLDMFTTQDNIVFVGQGEISDRTQEHLGEVDRGIILFRQMLRDQMGILEDGGQPINVFRDPKSNVSIKIPTVTDYYGRGRSRDGSYQKGAITAAFSMRYSPIAEQLEDLFLKEAEARARSLK